VIPRHNTEPEITRDAGGFVVTDRWECYGGEFVLHVFAGFHTDLASVPRIFWPLLSLVDLGFGAPIAHDFLYQCGGVPPIGTCYPSAKRFTRREIDLLFSDLMAEFGVVPWRRRLAWSAVRLCGWAAFRGRPSELE